MSEEIKPVFSTPARLYMVNTVIYLFLHISATFFKEKTHTKKLCFTTDSE